MRKRVTVVTLVVAGAFAASASASFDPHFDVLTKVKSSHEVNGRFVFREKVVDPSDLRNKVGSDRGSCKPLTNRSAFCRVVYFLNGEIGGRGTIRVRGTIGGGNGHRLNVTGGGGDFNGVAGKQIVKNPDIGPKWGLQVFSLVR